jgi:FMN phosphatase YigB (HAD superfamily)
MSVDGGVQFRPPATRRRQVPHLVITDVDNTLYDFGRYFEAGLGGLVRSTVANVGISEQEVLATLKQIFTRHGSIEYPFALEEFPAVIELSDQRRKEVMDLTSDAFWSSASLALVPYPGVVLALQDLQREGIDVVAFTDAPIHEAVRRLRALGIDQYLTGVVATEWFGRRSTVALRVKDVPGFIRIPSRLKVVGRLNESQRKPNPQTYATIMNAFKLTPDNVTVIGDSPARDLEPAAALGMQPVWARYGRRSPSKEILLQQVVPFKLPEIKTPQDAAAVDFPAVDRFDQLLDLLPTQQILPLKMN